MCPLCKQPFTSIIHNVRSELDYNRYRLPLPPPPADPQNPFIFQPGYVLHLPAGVRGGDAARWSDWPGVCSGVGLAAPYFAAPE